MKKVAALVVSFLFFIPNSALAAQKTIQFKAEVWADNWFALYVNGKIVGQDSVPITTTKSFNKETILFNATYPLTVAIIAKDYVENKSGLEYIGQPNQQIGDGGIIAQIHEKSSGKLVGVTNNTWREKTINFAPLNVECASSLNPVKDCESNELSVSKNWYSVAYKDTSWNFATEYSEKEVGPKDGYYTVQWDPSARLIWGRDLRIENVILLRHTFISAVTAKFSVTIPGAFDGIFPKESTCDGVGAIPSLTWRNPPAQTKSILVTLTTIPGPTRPGENTETIHYLLLAYDMKPTQGSLSNYLLGENFQGKKLYAPPCSQGPGVKTYTFTVYALKNLFGNQVFLTSTNIQNFLTINTIEKVEVSLNYSRQ